MMAIPKNWTNIQTLEEVAFLLEDLEECKRVAYDTETTGLSIKDEVFGVSFAVGDSETEPKAVRRVYWCNFNVVSEAVKDAVLEVIRRLFTEGRWNLMFHNAAFDIRMTRASFDIPLLHTNINCSQLLALVVCRWPNVKLKYLTGIVLNRQPVWAKEVNAFKLKAGFKVEDDDFPYTLIPAELVFPYACEDAQNTFELFYAILQYYKYENASLQEIYKLERQVACVCARLEFQGMTIDLSYFETLAAKLRSELEVESKYYSERWGTYKNSKKEIVPTIHSSQQLGKIIFDPNFPNGLKLPLEYASYTPGGAISVKMDELVEHFPDNEDIQRLAMYIFRQSALDDYVDSILRNHIKWVEDDGSPAPPTIHTSYWQIKSTGRFGSAKINLQNITNDKLASAEEREYSIRRGFVAPPGYLYVAIDYKAFEVAILANASQDPKLVADVINNVDFHSTVGSMAYNRPYAELRNHVDELAKLQRTKIKRTSFAFIYGAGVKRIASTTGISFDEAQAIKNALRGAYPGMMSWWDLTYQAAGRAGKIYTLCGRMRRIEPDKAYTTAVNTVCQGTAADVMKYAHVELETLLAPTKSRQVATIHDEIHFYLHPDDVEVVPDIVRIMETRRFDPPNDGVYVPMAVELSSGPNWSDMKEQTVEQIQTTLREMADGRKLETTV